MTLLNKATNDTNLTNYSLAILYDLRVLYSFFSGLVLFNRGATADGRIHLQHAFPPPRRYKRGSVPDKLAWNRTAPP